MGGTFDGAMADAITPPLPHTSVAATPGEKKALLFRALYMNTWMNIVAAAPARNTLAPVGYVITLTPNFLLQLLENGSERHRRVTEELVANGSSMREKGWTL